MEEEAEHPVGLAKKGSRMETETDFGDDEEEDDSLLDQFLSTLRRCPDQIMRYQTMGKALSLDPLQFSSGDLPPRCETCGASRGFELQLMPKLVDLTGRRLQFGTIQGTVNITNLIAQHNRLLIGPKLLINVHKLVDDSNSIKK